jgi:hypothetical protein
MSNANSTPASSAPVSPAVPAANVAATPSKPVVTEPKPAGSAAPVAEETFEVVVDGKAEKKTRKEIIEAYQLRQLSDKKRSEADKVLAEYKKLQEVASQDPLKFMKAMGYDIDKIATGYLSKKAEDAMKDPKVLEAEKLKAENEQYKQWVLEQKALQERTQREQEIATERSKIHAEIIEAIEEKKELGLPVDEELVIAIAQQMMVQDKAKKPLNAKEALPAAYAKTQRWLQGMASKMEGEALVKWLGEDVSKKIRKYDLTQLKAKRKVPENQALVKPQNQKLAPKEKPYETWSAFKARKLDTIK